MTENEKVLGLTLEQVVIGLLGVIVVYLGLDKYLKQKPGAQQTTTTTKETPATTPTQTSTPTSPTVTNTPTTEPENHKNPVQTEIITEVQKELAANPTTASITDQMTQALIKANGLKTYNIKLDADDKGVFDANAGPFAKPAVNDLDGLPHSGVPAPGYDGWLDYTKKTFGVKDTDPLGLNGWKAFYKAHSTAASGGTVNMDAFWINYIWEVPARTPSAPSAPATIVKPDITGLPAGDKSTIDALGFNDLKNYVAKWKNYSDPVSKLKVAYGDYLLKTKYNNENVASTTTNPVAKTIYSGGTVINQPAPTVICEKASDGNMYCHPK